MDWMRFPAQAPSLPLDPAGARAQALLLHIMESLRLEKTPRSSGATSVVLLWSSAGAPGLGKITLSANGCEME